jgi:hypothetical protein
MPDTIPTTTAGKILLIAQIAGQVIPIVALSITALRAILASQDVDPAVYARIEAAYTDRIGQAEREATAHGHPIDPGGGIGI